MEKKRFRYFYWYGNDEKRICYWKFLSLFLFVFTFSVEASNSLAAAKSSHSGNGVSSQQQAQTKQVKGKVVDPNGESIIGAAVKLINSSIGTITDNVGNFSITIPIDAKTILISYLGYESQNITLGTQSFIRVVLNEKLQGLQEVVVVGYGTQKKESVVGSISQVKSKELQSAGVRTLTNALSGLVPGLVTQQSNGQPGKDAAAIFIRGRSTWQNSSPLVLVDGIERSMNDIDPNEVETVSVLKDASATAVYGTRGGNGVIIVTTKRGTNKTPEMTLSFNQGFKTPTGRSTFVDSYTTMSYANEAMKNDNNWIGLTSNTDLEHYKNQDSPLFYPSVDWSKEMIKQVSFQTDMNFNVSGGTDKLKYFGSLGYLYDGDILNTSKSDGFDGRFYAKRYNLRTNLDYQATKNTLVSFNVGGSFKQINQPAVNNLSLWKGIYYNSPTDSPLLYEPWVLEQYPDRNDPNASGTRYAWGSGKYGSIMSPITAIYTGGNASSAGFGKQDENQFNVDLKLHQDLDFITKGLSFSALLSYNLNTNYSNTFTRVIPKYRLLPDGTWQRSPEYGGDTDNLEELNYRGTSFNSNTQKLYYEGRMNYDRKFDKHDLSLLGVFKRSERNLVSGSNVNEPFKDEDWAGRITYNYDLRYLFEANLSLSGSEQFAPKTRFGFFPAFAVGWNLAEEQFFKESSLSFINKFKTRATWGKTGTTSGARWLYYAAPWVTGSTASTGGLGGSISTWNVAGAGYEEGPYANVDAKWEESVKKNLGFELGILENMFTLNVDLYDENRDNILMPPTSQIPAWGAFDGKERNYGKTMNHGYEIELMFNKRLGKGFRYFIGGNISFNENRVIYRGDAAGTAFYQKYAGHPIDVKLEMLQNSLFQSVDDINNYIAPPAATQLIEGDIKYIDYNADGKIDANDTAPLEFQIYPRYDYAIKGGFDYRNFSFSFLVQGNQDKNIELYGHQNPFGNVPTGIARMESYQFDHYTPETRNSALPAYHFSGDVQKYNNDYPSSGSRRIIPSDYIRLKMVELTYTFSNNLLTKSHIKSIVMYLNGNNLVTLSPLRQKFIDPEKPIFLAGNGGYDYPMARRFNFGFRFNF
ncbi:MAG: TonB-dependent receptor [Paludibacter sp.]|nr:TonB-dependent receptor [Paludibacter sp.]